LKALAQQAGDSALAQQLRQLAKLRAAEARRIRQAGEDARRAEQAAADEIERRSSVRDSLHCMTLR
jgi:hypothetical protein